MKLRLTLIYMLFAQIVLGQRGVVNYTKENGLISNEVVDVAYDQNGFLWIATNSGIDRFDGQRFIHFQHDPDDKKTICSNRIIRIVYDPKGFVWASTVSGGLIRISIKTFAVKNYYYQKSVKNSISDNRATTIFIDGDDETWIAPLFRGLDYYDAKKDHFVNYRPSDQYPNLDARIINLFSDVQVDRTNQSIFWCASLDGLFSFNKKTKRWKHYPVIKPRFLDLTNLIGFESSMRCIEQDGKGNLYIGTWGGGLLYFDKNQGVYRRFVYEKESPSSGLRNNISDLKWRDSRYLYVCAPHYEFLLFDTKTKEFIRYDRAERTILSPERLARFGAQIAIAGTPNGLFIHNESLIFGQRERHPFDMRRIAFHPAKDEWLAINYSNNGQLYFKQKDQPAKLFSLFEGVRDDEFFFVKPHYIGNERYLIVASDRIIAFSATAGMKELVKFDNINKGLALHATTPIISFNDGDSVIWIGTKYGGILHYSIRNNTLKSYLHNPKNSALGPRSNAWFFSFVQYKDTLYYGYEEGIGAIDLHTKRFFVPKIAQLFPRENARAMVVDPEGKLWIATMANGIVVIDLKKQRIVHRITAKMGLQSPRIDRLICDNHNRVWAVNSYCVAIIDRSNYTIQSLENQHGMSGIYDIVLHKNTLYFLQNDGFVMSNSGSSLPRINNPQPYIQRVRELNDQPFVRNKKVFDFNQNNLGFEFGVLDYSNSMNNFVSYRLKGLEDSWRSGNGKDEATYYNLPGGNYVFQVRIIEDGRAHLAEYEFKIIPPFWTQWWFILLSVVVIAGIIWWYVRIRIRRVESTERMRTEFNRQINEMESKALRAQMNPHFLFNSLNSIRLFILKNEVESASDYIAKFSKLLRMILNHSRLDMITVYDEIQTLKLYLEFERLRFDQGFEFDLQIDGQEVLDCHIPPMIIQPFVENAIWHGLMPRQDDHGYIKVSFQSEPGRLIVTVLDNGIGRKKARENKSKGSLKEGSVGLQITKERLRTLTRRTGRLNDFAIEDLVDDQNQATGTLIKLYFETEEK